VMRNMNGHMDRAMVRDMMDDRVMHHDMVYDHMMKMRRSRRRGMPHWARVGRGAAGRMARGVLLRPRSRGRERNQAHSNCRNQKFFHEYPPQL